MNILRLFRKQNKDIPKVNVSLQNADLNCKTGHYKTAFSAYLQLAEQGYAEAQFKLGKLYFYGKGTYKDQEQAILWMKKAVQQNYTQATDFINRIHNPEYSYEELSLYLDEIKTALCHITKENNIKVPIFVKLTLTVLKISCSIMNWSDSKKPDNTPIENDSIDQKQKILFVAESLIAYCYLLPKIIRIAGIEFNEIYFQPNSRPIPLLFNDTISHEERTIRTYEKMYYSFNFLDDSSILKILRIFGKKQQDLFLAYKTDNISDFFKKAQDTDLLLVTIHTIYELNKSKKFEDRKQTLYDKIKQYDCMSLEDISSTINEYKEDIDIITSFKNASHRTCSQLSHSLPNKKLQKTRRGILLFCVSLLQDNDISAYIKNEVYSLIEEYNFSLGGLTKEFEDQFYKKIKRIDVIYSFFEEEIDDYIEELKSPLEEKHDVKSDADDTQSINLENEEINQITPNENKIRLDQATSIQTLINAATKDKTRRKEFYHSSLKYLYQYLTENDNFKDKIKNKKGEIIKDVIDCTEEDFMYVLGDSQTTKEKTSENPVINWNEGEQNSMRGFFYALYGELDKPISEDKNLSIGSSNKKYCYLYKGKEIKLSTNKNAADEAKKQWTKIIKICVAKAKKELGLAS